VTGERRKASNATIAVNKAVIERIHRLKNLTVEVRAGRAVRRYRAVKSDGPDDLVFPSLVNAGPMRDNNILTRHIKPLPESLASGSSIGAACAPVMRLGSRWLALT
jgi:hypothetical protein